MDGLRRGDVVTVALQGDQGKPRPALVVQSDRFAELAAVTVLPITSTLLDAPGLRLTLEPGARNGLVTRSQIMVDKPQTLQRTKVGGVIGRLNPPALSAVNAAMLVFFGLA